MQRDLIGQLVRFLKHIYNNILCIIYFPDRSWSVSIDFCLYFMSYISTICVVEWSTCSINVHHINVIFIVLIIFCTNLNKMDIE